jgi:hypothetical protein
MRHPSLSVLIRVIRGSCFLSDQQILDDVSMDIGETVAAALKAEGQFRVVDAQAVQQRGVQVVDVDGILGDVVAVVVRAAVCLASFDAASGQPQAEATRVMIPTVVIFCETSLAVHSAAEFSSPDDQRVVEKSSLF